MAAPQMGIAEPRKDMIERVTSLFRPKTNALECAINRLDPLQASLEDIPQPPNCYTCGSPTVKAFIDYEYDSAYRNGTRVTIAKRLPGYRCQDCDVQYQEPSLSDSFLQHAAAALEELGDTSLSEALRLDAAHPSTYTAFSEIPPAVQERLTHSP